MATNFPNINGDAEGSKPPPLGPIFIPIPNKSAAPRRVQAEPEAFTGALFVPSNLNQEVTNGDIYSRCTFGSGTRIGVDVVAGDKLTVINSEFGVDCTIGNNCTFYRCTFGPNFTCGNNCSFRDCHFLGPKKQGERCRFSNVTSTLVDGDSP